MPEGQEVMSSNYGQKSDRTTDRCTTAALISALMLHTDSTRAYRRTGQVYTHNQQAGCVCVLLTLCKAFIQPIHNCEGGLFSPDFGSFAT